MLLYLLFWTILGFIFHFYTVFGTNLLTGGPVQIAIFCLFQCFTEKEYQTESKRNETFGTWFSERTWSRGLGPYVKTSTRKARGRGRAYPPPRRALHPRGPPVAPPTYSFLLYIPTNHQTTRDGAKNLIPPSQLSVSTRSHLGACSKAPPEGASITEGFYINTVASPMMCE